MISVAKTFSGKPRQASMAAYRQLLAENHVEDILTDVKQNKNLDRKKELPVWLPLAECFTNGVRKAEDAVASGLYFLDIDEKGLTEALWKKVREENLIEEFRIVSSSNTSSLFIWLIFSILGSSSFFRTKNLIPTVFLPLFIGS